MKYRLCILTLIFALVMLPSCGSSTQEQKESESNVPDNSSGTVSVSWHEIGEGPLGWVIGIMVENNTEERFTEDVAVTITDDDGTILGEDTVKIDVAPNDWDDYPVHCEAGSAYNVDIRAIENIDQSTEVKQFPLIFEETIESLNVSLADDGIKLSDPIVSPGDTSELGKHTAYTYTLGDGASLVLYASDATDHVLNMTVMTVYSEIDDTSMDHVSAVIDCLLQGLAGDAYTDICEELGITNTSDDTYASASNGQIDFMYMVQGGSIVFMATPA